MIPTSAASALGGVDVGERAEAVVFKFEDVVGVVEWLGDPGEAHRLDAGKHYPSAAV